MPTYDYKCEVCGTVQEIIHSIKSDPVIECPKCAKSDIKARMTRLISGGAGFNLGSTETMAWKEKRIRAKNSAKTELKQMERWSNHNKLVPNVGGEVAENWSDAAKLAKDRGKDSLSYTKKIVEEKSTSKDSGVNDKLWKSAKSKLGKS
jgi:predicted nucleic acid-binding Zn ribbon protein